ncbi:VWA domain-containing protein [Bailinhaonella thermotolerans]|uniref:VWA domain-containing protein n=1 Tax=Bailinhaonella thermotolerans TaxID=1070861 RepID=A0A3A4APS3_9ACTN|nr:VWA domain-containing protein [Bailinhaonella thermotolerans]
MLAALAVLVGVAGVSTVVLGKTGGGCSGRPVLVSVAAALDVAAPVMAAAERFNAAAPAMPGPCVLVEVTEQAPATVMRTLAGGRLGVLREKPDAWVADSSAWVRMARRSGAVGLPEPETSVATSPLVFATKRSLADTFAAGKTEMSWNMVFPSTTRGEPAPDKDEPDVVRIPDPSVSGAGVVTVAAARDIAGEGEKGRRWLTAFVRMAQATSAPDYRSMLATLSEASFWQRPVVIVPEQSVWEHNRRAGAEPLVALHPKEGTVSLDYPYVVTAEGKEEAEAARRFAGWLASPETRTAVQRMGFRGHDGSTGPEFAGPGAEPGVPTENPRPRPSLTPEFVDEALDAWSKLAPMTRMLVVTEVSDAMSDEVRKGVTRLDVALEAVTIGLPLFPNDTQIGVWEFADGIAGSRPYREKVSLGPLTEPAGGDVIRRSRLMRLTTELKPRDAGRKGLNDATLAAFRRMTEQFNPGMNNTVLLLTSGRDEPGGIGHRDLIDALRKEWTPEEPVQIVVVAFGKDVDRAAMTEISQVTNGSVHVAQHPGEIIDVFLNALARRLCTPNCAN